MSLQSSNHRREDDVEMLDLWMGNACFSLFLHSVASGEDKDRAVLCLEGERWDVGAGRHHLCYVLRV